MKITVLGVILSLILSSLPAKVWACGLNLCPMSHHMTSSAEKNSMPCHQIEKSSTDHRKIKKSKKSPSNETKIASQKNCPCPQSFSTISFVPETRSPIELIRFSSYSTGNFQLASPVEVKTQPLFYQPPPFNSSLRLHAVLQTFII